MAATLSPSVNQFQNFKLVGYRYATFVVECKQNIKIHLLEYKRTEECNTNDVKPMKNHTEHMKYSAYGLDS